jgi:glycosyltransferase involved in cell wall biosynthesis
VRARWGLGSGTRVVTFIGRKRQAKDISVLVEAVRRAARTNDIVLVLVGPQYDWDRRPLAGLDPRELRVIDVPAIPEEAKVAVLAASDIVVQPSWQEAFGIVFLEAWASRVPVIGAAWGPIPGVLADEGLTFQRGDVADLEAKLDWLLTHPEDAQAMAERGRKRVAREHTWERVGLAVEKAYGIALRGRGRRDPGAGEPSLLR